ncbi:hypothetical protein BJX63DRAFT_387626 [Aspergillus granulosus]|uniref:Uncharacterized protein n=1 Tax=Aspergillus granulosus TaxID=176169 RepID=A0ABR4HM37_9EURO
MTPLAAAGIIALIVAAWLLKRAFLPRPVLALIIVTSEIITFSISFASRARSIRPKFATDGCLTSCTICVGALGGCSLFNCASWYVTLNLEWDIHRMPRRRIRAEKEGRLFSEDEVKYFDERK